MEISLKIHLYTCFHNYSIVECHPSTMALRIFVIACAIIQLWITLKPSYHVSWNQHEIKASKLFHIFINRKLRLLSSRWQIWFARLSISHGWSSINADFGPSVVIRLACIWMELFCILRIKFIPELKSFKRPMATNHGSLIRLLMSAVLWRNPLIQWQ